MVDEKKVREAIEAFQGQVNWLKRIDDKGCEEVRRCCIEYFETAIEALEKQLQKKPKEEKDAYTSKLGEFRVGKCPNCEMEASDRFDICIDCGQKLDWTVEE